MRSYELQFLPRAVAEWDTLDGSVRQQFAEVLLKRLDNPRMPAAALSSMPDCYKIKLRTAGYRLVYRVQNGALVLLTIAIGKRDKSAVYDAAKIRLKTVSDKVTKTKAKFIKKLPKDAGAK
jgi:mRNA interferase RelE/StbE